MTEWTNLTEIYPLVYPLMFFVEVERFWSVLLPRVSRVAMVDLQVGGMNRRPRADEACSSFAELLASIPDVGLDSDFERPVYSAEACDAVG
jgi:hypothetical protein